MFMNSLASYSELLSFVVILFTNFFILTLFTLGEWEAEKVL